jgi:hypothetical protein
LQRGGSVREKQKFSGRKKMTQRYSQIAIEKASGRIKNCSMKFALLAHFSSQPHLHKSDAALIVAVMAIAAVAYFLFRRVER